MKKSKSLPKAYTQSLPESTVNEPYIETPRINKLQAAVSDFSYKKFEKIANRIPFTLTDWANILHLSERTLQRYAKDNKNFEGIYVDRIFQIEKIINLGLEVFNGPLALYQWLKKPKEVMGEQIEFNALCHTDGIQHIHNQLGRIQQGVYA